MRTVTNRSVRRRHPPRLLLVMLVLAALPLLASTCLRVPTSASAPPGLYLLTYRQPARGDWVVACLPRHLGLFGRRRGYLAAGRCPGDAVEVLKRVAALPGDRVEVSSSGLVVEGEALRRTRRRTVDSAGRPIPQIAAGTRRVAAGTVWLYSSQVPTSWDSRYFGAVPLAGVRSTARRLPMTRLYANRSDSSTPLVHLLAVRSPKP